MIQLECRDLIFNASAKRRLRFALDGKRCLVCGCELQARERQVRWRVLLLLYKVECSFVVLSSRRMPPAKHTQGLVQTAKT